MRRVAIALIVLAIAIAGAVRAETIVTDAGHFRVHYSPGTRETAKEVAIVAEEVFYQLVTAFDLHEEVRPIDILVTDNIDIGNGFADYYENQVAIWATNLDWQLRGTHRWLRNVVSHELAHIFSLKLARRYPFRYGLISASVLNSQDIDFGLSIPIYSLVTPSWWVEGIAQYESERADGDSWDSHRDMLLRAATLEKDLLSYDEMGVFAHNWLHSEMVYNQGFALNRYIGQRFGVDKPRELARETGFLTFDAALKDVVGLSGDRVYRDWTADLRRRYGAVLDSIGTQVEGTEIGDEGSFEWSPAISDDGTRIAYVSAGTSDYLDTKLRVVHLPSGEVRKIDEEVFGNVAWFPSGDKIVYTKFGRGTLYLDLFVYDLARNRERRITSQMRARDPAVSPDGEWIAFVSTEDGGNRIGMIRADGSQLRWLTNDRRSSGERSTLAGKTNTFTQIHTPQWSPDGKWLLFSIFGERDRDIALMSTGGPYFNIRSALSDTAAFPDSVLYPAGVEFRIVAGTAADERDPSWLPDGSGFVYSANHGGIFNIYRRTFSTEGEPTTVKLTNVIGGAFMPDISTDGNLLAYAGYHANDFSIYTLPLTGGEAPRVAQIEAPPEAGERNYRDIPEVPSADALFYVGPTMSARKVVGWVPTIRFGPNFVGDQFTVNHVGGGIAAAVEDGLAGRFYYAEASAAKNLGNKDPLSTDVLLYAEQGLQPVLTSDWGFQPSLYVYGGRTQIGIVNDFVQYVVPPFNPGQIDLSSGSVSLSDDSQASITDTITSSDSYNYLNAGFGFRAGLGRHSFATELSWRRFSLGEEVDVTRSNTSLFKRADDNTDVTGLLSPAEWGNWPLPGQPFILENAPQFDMRYFEDRALTLAWSWGKGNATVDADVNPSGRFISFAYRFHSVNLADSLGMAGFDLDFDGQPDLVDPNAPPLRAVRRHLTVNEVILSWNEFIRLPGTLGRTTLALTGLVGYLDQPTKYPDPLDPTLNFFEGWAYWPLRYRLGGAGTLRGYPYFSHEGSKLAFFRASLVFPIIPSWGKQLLNYYHSRTYGAFFVESGSTWNWERLADAKIYRDDFLWDAGAELRMAGFTFYQLPISGYAAVARRMSDLPEPFVDHVLDEFGNIVAVQPDQIRYYLGFTIGFAGGGMRDRTFAGIESRPTERGIRPNTPYGMRDPVDLAGDYARTPWTGAETTPRLDAGRTPAVPETLLPAVNR